MTTAPVAIKHSSGGFSIIELTVVMLLLAALAAFVVPRLNLRGFNDVTTRDQLLAAARQAQQLAMNLENASVQLVLTSQSYSIRIDGSDINDPSGQSYPQQLVSGLSLTPAPTTLSFSRLGALNGPAIRIRILGGDNASQLCIESTGYVHAC